MTSLYCADAHQDLRRHVEDDVRSDQEDAIQDIRLFVDKALALSLKYGPFNDAEIKTLEFRMDFLRTLISYHKSRINPSLM
jgi:membrane-associated HD superfamily phosphohydrolase